MTRKQLADLFTPIYDQFAQVKFEEVKMESDRIVDEIDDTTQDWKHNEISGLGAWDEVNEDVDEGDDEFIIGYEKTLSLGKKRKKFYVTFEVSLEQEYANLEKKIVDAQALGQGGRERVQINRFANLYNGFTTAGPDGQYVFSNAHPKNPVETSKTYDNLLDGPFSHDNLELAEKQIANNNFDLDGSPIVLPQKPILCYAPALAGVVERVLSDRATERPGTPNRDINRFAGKYDLLESIYLGAEMGGSDTAWYIVYPGTKSIKFIWGQKAQYASWIDNALHRYWFDGWMFFSTGIVSWRGLFASTGL